MKKLYIDVGSTYFKIKDKNGISHYFRDFDKDIFTDLRDKYSSSFEKYEKEDIYICSSANGGLNTLIIALTNSFSLKYATNIAYNSGINIIETILYPKIKEYPVASETIDVVIIVGGTDGVKDIFFDDLTGYLGKLSYLNIVYAGSGANVGFIKENIPDITILPNIIDDRLHVREEYLKEYLVNLYQNDIMGKEDIKDLYAITANQIYSTPYVVNRTLPFIGDRFYDVVDPFILIDIGGATTDIHYSTDLVEDNMIIESGYDRLVFKKLGVYKSRESLVFGAKNNEFVYELLNYLNVTENILDQKDEQATKVLMLLSVFLVLYKVSSLCDGYLTLSLARLKSVVFTGGITKVLETDDIEKIMYFTYGKLLGFTKIPKIILDKEYEIWTLRRDHVC